ncbi:MAG: hypothetical protein WBD27_15155 [Pyrinomonadaceae bacterium]
MKKNESRIVLRRSKESRTLRSIGVIVYLAIVLLFIWAFIAEFDEENWILSMALVFLPGFLICVRELLRKVVLLENYISFSTWYGRPKVYAYDQIKNVETYVIDSDKWTLEPETYVKVTFEDGRSMKVYKSLMSVREFRKFLRTKTGRTFRKSATRN